MQNRTWTAIGLSPVFLPSRTRVKETCFEYKIQSCYAVNDLHGPAKNGVKPFLKSQRILVRIPSGETRWLWSSFWILQEAMNGLHGPVNLDESFLKCCPLPKPSATRILGEFQSEKRDGFENISWIILKIFKNSAAVCSYDKILMNKKNI